jgi:hypothetical protein
MSKAGRDKGHLSHRPSPQVLPLGTPCRWIAAHSAKIVHFASAVSMATDGVAQALLLTLPRRRAMRSGQGNGKGYHASVVAPSMLRAASGCTWTPCQWPCTVQSHREAAASSTTDTTDAMSKSARTKDQRRVAAPISHSPRTKGLLKAAGPWWSHLWSHPSTFASVHRCSDQCVGADRGR